ncbi:MAG: SH3 domain-containing protein, partial [Kiritimatiellae bacterium]|nr:SH3 domain-containing protein [Kiritimatiellia bacterium]
MKTTIFPILVLAAATAFADGRIQVSAASTSVRARPDAQSAALGEVRQGTILFPSGSPRGEWTPVEPPADVALWLHGEFVQGSRVIAKSVQLRTGPGLEYDVAGNLSRGATVMTLGEEGEW